MGARLLYRDSRGQDGQVALAPETPCYVGRALDCAIRTDDAMVSRKHSMIRMENGAYYVEDLGSSNGTHVNNQRVSKHRLTHNDVVRCGSLLLRYVEDGPLVAPNPGRPAAAPAQPAAQVPGMGAAQPGQQYGAGYGAGAPGYPGAQGGAYGAEAGASTPSYAGAPAGGNPFAPAADYGAGAQAGTMSGAQGAGKRGTQRIDSGAGAGSGAGASSGAGAAGAASLAPAVPSGPPSYVSQSGIFGGSAAAASYGGPPPMPRDSAMGFGPPEMPPDGNPFGPPPMPSLDAVIGTPPESRNPFARPGQDDPGPSDTVDEAVERLSKDLEDSRRRLDELQASYDREVADGKRMRAEAATLRDKIQQLNEAILDREEQIKAHQGVAEDLRREQANTREELARARGDLAELAEEMHTKERQIGRIQEDIAKLKDEKEDVGRQLVEVSKTKDEGWKKLNEQLSEIEHLREVINEQERMLEERRVGLVSQEVVIKELRDAREKQIQAMAQLKAERDELQADLRRQQAQLQTVEEENKRLSRLLTEAQAGGHAATVDLTNELREARIEVKKLEADCDRFQELYEQTKGEVQALEERAAQLDNELRAARQSSTTATSTQSVIEESLAKAEAARHKAAEEALRVSKERDDARAATEQVRREAERLKRRIEELESAAPRAQEDPQTRAENEALKRKLAVAETRTAELERSLGELRTELDTARAQGAGAAPAAASGAASAGPSSEVMDAIRNKAVEVYENINDVLSDIRNNLKLVHSDFTGLAGERTDDSVRIIFETLQTLIDSAEDAKGVVRGLRELAEFG
jgi:pSer/pThr/pTyr-binding forkhead associated (FHA) protein/DNA repair exonuclease SbcCD ATPase subunit